jgi:hypothetical protein
VALTDEQRTMLQLLLEGGQGYDDIASLLGTSADDVRSRARGALGEIAGADPDSQVGLSDYLLGQADPIGRADAVRHLRSDPQANAMAQRLVQNLRLLAPKADLPEIPQSDGRRAAPAPPPPASAPPSGTPAAPHSGAPVSPGPSRQPRGEGIASRAASFFSGLGSLEGKRRTQAILVGAFALVAIIVVLVLITSSGGGGGDCAPLDTSASQQSGAPTLDLKAVGAAADQDCAPEGQITLVPVQGQGKQQQQLAGFALQANANHLEPTENGEVYVLWLFASDQQSRPLGQVTVKDDGNLTGAAPLPTAYLPLLQQGSIRISKVSSSDAQQLQSALKQQSKDPKKATGFVPFTGTAVLEGSGQELLAQLQQLIQQAQAAGGASGGTGATGGTGASGTGGNSQ